MPDQPSSNPKGAHLRKMMLAALGVVFGDIGTSPLYTLREAFSPEHFLQLNQLNVLGVLSLIIWSLILVVGVKYILFVMRADNHGEGGILALMTLAQRVVKNRSSRLVMLIGLAGAALFYGDGIITPAISVLSAVEGLSVATPFFDPYIVPLAILILVILFGFQHNGSEAIGRLFGPVTALWFLSIGAAGAYQIILHPDILWSFSPFYAFYFLIENSTTGLLILGTVVLCITGVEAIYADMGHFGIKPIRLLWLYFVLPCLVMNYIGQGALMLHQPETLANPFYKMVPSFLLYPMVILATLATAIASQAMISGAFTVTQQAMQLGLLPRFKILHTSSRHIGQVYIPALNVILFIGVILLVLWFHSSSALASAYGIAVTGTMTMTSCLAFMVVRRLWHWSLWKSILLFTPIIVIDVTYLATTITKLGQSSGAWIPVLLGIAMFTIMLTWFDGKRLKNARLIHGKERMETFIRRVDEEAIPQLQGVAVYMTRNLDYVPPALAMNLKYYHAIHQKNLLVSVNTLDIPRVKEKDRITIHSIHPAFACVTLQYGFMQQPNVPRALGKLAQYGLDWDMAHATYFMNRFRVVPTKGSGLWYWREKLYAVMYRNSAEASDYFSLPTKRVLEIGSPITI